MRPKSIATVVSAFCDRVSSVMSFSVDSTVISLIVRMSVVFPAANGPVTTILTAWALPPRRPRLMAMSQPPHAGDKTQQQTLIHAGIALDVGLVVCGFSYGKPSGSGNRSRGTAAADPGDARPWAVFRKLWAPPWHERLGPRRRHPGVGDQMRGDAVVEPSSGSLHRRHLDVAARGTGSRGTREGGRLTGRSSGEH